MKTVITSDKKPRFEGWSLSVVQKKVDVLSRLQSHQASKQHLNK